MQKNWYRCDVGCEGVVLLDAGELDSGVVDDTCKATKALYATRASESCLVSVGNRRGVGGESQRIPAAVVYRAFEPTGDQRGDAVVQPQATDFLPARVVQVLSAATSHRDVCFSVDVEVG